MANTFTTVTNQSYGGRIMNSIIGVPVGIILILGSSIMLYLNEGRIDYSKIASKSQAVNASQVDQSQNGKFVSVTGSVSTDQQIGDGQYLKPGYYVAIQRNVEEYAWTETANSNTQNNIGGSSTTTTTYTYNLQWTDQPEDSSNFKQPSGHQNPPLALNNTEVLADNAKVGAYSFDPKSIKINDQEDINLNSSNVNIPVPTTTTSTTTTSDPLSNVVLASPEYLYEGNGTLTSPQVGAIRISYKGLLPGTNATVFGTLNNGAITSYAFSSKNSFYEIINGDRQTAIQTLNNQYQATIWLFRAIGVGLLWFGLTLLFGPLDAILDFIPIVGEIGKILIAIITLPVALILGVSIILIGYFAHHLITLIIMIPLMLAIFIGIFKLIKKARKIPKRGTTPQPQAFQPNPMTNQPTMPINNMPIAANNGSLFPNAPTPQPTQPPMPVNNIPPQPSGGSLFPNAPTPQPTQPPMPVNNIPPQPSGGSLFPNNNPPTPQNPNNQQGYQPPTPGGY